VTIIKCLIFSQPISGKYTKEKSKKLALIAVCNKLLKQAFAVAKSGLPYDENYRSTLAKNN
jgi:hypothetical protein